MATYHHLNAFISSFPETEILETAARSDERRKQGKSLGPLDGIPIAIKVGQSDHSQLLTSTDVPRHAHEYSYR